MANQPLYHCTITALSKIRSLFRGRAMRRIHASVPSLDETTVSVVIPVKNGGEELRGLLTALRQQEGPMRLEIVVVDSGSTDASLEVAGKQGAKIIEIPAKSFSHSHARNLGADNATGDYLLFTVQDALPPSSSWLREMFAPIVRDGVVAVSCGESPRPDCDLFYRAASWYHHKFLEIETQDRILRLPRSGDYVSLRKNAQLTDTACLIRKDVFLKYRYRGDYAEDLDLGLRLVRDGHLLALLGSTRIIHSHNRPAYYHLRRGYVDSLALLRIFPDHPSTALRAECLLHQIVDAFLRVGAVVRTDLAEVGVPCTHSEFRRLVLQGLDRAVEPAIPSDEQLCQHVDQSASAFVEMLRAGTRTSGNADPTDGNVTVQAVRGFADAMLKYMRSTHQAIDAELLDAFRPVLYKVWALQSGSLLASSYFHGDDEEKAKLQPIHQELTRGV